MVSVDIRKVYFERGLPTRVYGRKAYRKCGGFWKPDTEIYLCRVLDGDEPWDWIGIDAVGETVAAAMTRRECEGQIKQLIAGRRRVYARIVAQEKAAERRATAERAYVKVGHAGW